MSHSTLLSLCSLLSPLVAIHPWAGPLYEIDGLSLWEENPEAPGELYGVPGIHQADSDPARLLYLSVVTPLLEPRKVPGCSCSAFRESWQCNDPNLGSDNLGPELLRTETAIAGHRSMCDQLCSAALSGRLGSAGTQRARGSPPACSKVLVRSGVWEGVRWTAGPEPVGADGEPLRGLRLGDGQYDLNPGILYTSGPPTGCPFLRSHTQPCLISGRRLSCDGVHVELTGKFYVNPSCDGESLYLLETRQSLVVALAIPPSIHMLSRERADLYKDVLLHEIRSMPRIGDEAPAQILAIMAKATENLSSRITRAEHAALAQVLSEVDRDRRTSGAIRRTITLEVYAGTLSRVTYGPGSIFIQPMRPVTSANFAMESSFTGWPITWTNGTGVSRGFLDVNSGVISTSAFLSDDSGPVLLRRNRTHSCDLRTACHEYHRTFQPEVGGWLAPVHLNLTIPVRSFIGQALIDAKYQWAAERHVVGDRGEVEALVELPPGSEVVTGSIWAYWLSLHPVARGGIAAAALFGLLAAVRTLVSFILFLYDWAVVGTPPRLQRLNGWTPPCGTLRRLCCLRSPGEDYDLSDIRVVH